MPCAFAPPHVRRKSSTLLSMDEPDPPSGWHKLRRWLRLRTGVLRNHTWGYLGPGAAHNQELTDPQGWDISWDHPRVVEPGGSLELMEFLLQLNYLNSKIAFGLWFCRIQGLSDIEGALDLGCLTKGGELVSDVPDMFADSVWPCFVPFHGHVKRIA